MPNQSDRIKILVLSHMYPNKTCMTNGIFIHNQIKHLHRAGCDVKVISPVPYSPKLLWFKPKWRSYGQVPHSDRIDKIPIYYPRYINLPGTWFRRIACWSNYVGIRCAIDKLVESFKPHIIHAHTATPSGYVALMLSKKYNIPLVCSLRGSDINVYPHYDNLSMHFTKQVLSRSNRIVSVSSSLKTAAEKLAVPKENIKVVYNGCDLNTFTFNHEYHRIYRNKLNISEKDKVITFVGELKENKGVYELIGAFKNLLMHHQKLHLLLVGEGSEHSNLKQIITVDNLENRVHFIGNKPHNEIANWLSVSDIFVLPTHYEGLPNVVLEAMSCGLPVVASNVGGIPEIIESGKNGILTKSKNVNSLTKSINYLLINEETANNLGSAGRKTIESKFSWERNAKDMVQVYREVLSV